MTLDSLVTSLDLSRRLKEVGCPQESMYFWVYSDYPTMPVQPRVLHTSQEKYVLASHKIASAFFPEELLRLLPKGLPSELDPNIPFRRSAWRDGVSCAVGDEHDVAVYETDDSPADNCAKLYLALKEKGLV